MTAGRAPRDDGPGEAVAASSLTPQSADQLAEILKAVSDPVRLRILSLIRQARESEACVQDLTQQLGISQPTTSRHLKILVTAGLLHREQRGKWAWYRVAPERAAAVSSLLE